MWEFAWLTWRVEEDVHAQRKFRWTTAHFTKGVALFRRLEGGLRLNEIDRRLEMGRLEGRGGEQLDGMMGCFKYGEEGRKDGKGRRVGEMVDRLLKW